MSRSTPFAPSRGLTPVTARIAEFGTDFEFRLWTRPLALGPDCTVGYYWMDLPGLRAPRGRADPVNYRNCVRLWWLAMRAEGVSGQPDQIRRLLLASCYPHVARSNALRGFYRDALLGRGATNPEADSLAADVRERILSAVRSRDPGRVRDEFGRALAGPESEAEPTLAMMQTYDGIMRHGVERVRADGVDGLNEFVGQFVVWSDEVRRKVGQGWLRPFLNRLGYECKVAFYACFANTWIALSPWLRDERGLDVVSERFLKCWNVQNQPVALSDRQVIPDVFRGQVLSLHPLSGFVMKDPALCALAGSFFGTGAYDRVYRDGRVGTCPEYWDLVGAILTAANLYRQALDRQAAGRGVRCRTGATVETAEAQAADRPVAGLLEDYAAARGVRCQVCARPVRLTDCPPVGPEADACRAVFSCPACHTVITISVDRGDLTGWCQDGR